MLFEILIKNSFVFNPCDFKSLVDFLLNYESPHSIDRSEFVQKFKRIKSGQIW